MIEGFFQLTKPHVKSKNQETPDTKNKGIFHGTLVFIWILINELIRVVAFLIIIRGIEYVIIFLGFKDNPFSMVIDYASGIGAIVFYLILLVNDLLNHYKQHL